MPLASLESLLEAAEATALVVVASSSRDPDLAPFVAEKVGEAFVIVAALGRWLGFFSPMDRDGAAALGPDWRLLTPEELAVGKAAKECQNAAELWGRVLSRGLSLAGRVPGRLALAGHLGAGVALELGQRLGAEGWSFVDGGEIVLNLRKTKSSQQLEAVRQAAAGTCCAMREVAAVLAAADDREGELWSGGERLRTGHLRARITEVLGPLGLEQPEGNIVAAGGEAAVPHNVGDDNRVLRPGESLVVDLYPRGRLFADCTRTFCVGDVPPRLREAHDAVRSCLDWATSQSVTGVTGWSLQEGVCERLAARGYPTPIDTPGTTRGYVHGLGHGVGFELHELPSFRKRDDSSGELAIGDVFTLEPGLYDPEAGYGVRLEDLVVLTAEGLDNLTALPYDLDPQAWGVEA